MFANIGSGSSQICKFGLPTLDEIIGGGLPRGTTWILEDMVGVDAEPFVVSFLANGLKSMDYVYLLSTENTFGSYKKKFQTFGRNPDTELGTGRLRFIDGFSGSYNLGLAGGGVDSTSGFSTSHTMMADQDAIQHLRDITQPHEINEAIRRSLFHVAESQQTAIRGACISLSSIIVSAPSFKDVYTFVQNRRAMDQRQNGTTLLTLHADAHDLKDVRSVEHLANGVLRLSNEVVNGDSVINVKVIAYNEKPETVGRETNFKYTAGRLTPLV